MAAPTTACPPGHPPCRFTTTRRRWSALLGLSEINLRSTSSGGPLVMLYRKRHTITAWQLPRPPAPPGHPPCRFTTTRRRLVRSARFISNQFSFIVFWRSVSHALSKTAQLYSMAAPTTACPPKHPPCRLTTTRRRWSALLGLSETKQPKTMATDAAADTLSSRSDLDGLSCNSDISINYQFPIAPL